jgi:hypothetical protein
LAVGIAMWVPWLGLWMSLLSPLSVVFVAAAVHARPPIGSVAYFAISVGSVGVGYGILRLGHLAPRRSA